MTDKDGTYKCPECQTIGIIKGRDINVQNVNWVWPLHNDCEWTKPIDDLDVSKLEKID